jgi:hypothetical protein
MKLAENPKHRKFLEALSALSRQYGIIITGCGCCGSPYLTEEQVPAAGTETTVPFYAQSDGDEQVIWCRQTDDGKLVRA